MSRIESTDTADTSRIESIDTLIHKWSKYKKDILYAFQAFLFLNFSITFLFGFLYEQVAKKTFPFFAGSHAPFIFRLILFCMTSMIPLMFYSIRFSQSYSYQLIKSNPSIFRIIVNELWTIPIDLLIKCCKWITSNILTIVFAIAIVFVFLYYEETLVEIFFQFIIKIKESKFGIFLLKGLFPIASFALLFFAIKTTINKTLSDGRTVFLSILICILFVYCTTKYPWDMENPEMAVSEAANSKIINPIIGYETPILSIFFQYVVCFLIIPFFRYCDISLSKIIYLHASKSTQTGSYLIDSPITSIDKDELFFGSHILALEKRIVEIPNTGSHSIAITGGWGTGKTSFLKLLEQKLKKQHQYEIMWFNPLKSSKSGSIQNDFFDVLESTLSKYKLGFGRRIKYYKELIGAIDNKYVSFLVKLGSIQLEEEKQRINDIIKMIPRKIIIIIDDVDRLKGDEIMQVFKLVSFNAEFDNVVFLIPLDKGNIIKALGCDANYPNKFFEMEFPLPDNYRHFTSLYVKNTLNTLLADIPQSSFLDNQIISDYTSYCINNMRDAKRFINTFIDRAIMIHDKLDLRSYYLLSLIQYKDLVLFEKIRTKNKELLDQTSDRQHLELIEDGCSKMDETLNQMLHDLFPKEKQTDGNFIYQPDFFPLYFNDSSTKVISDAKMLGLLQLEWNALQPILKGYENDNLLYQSAKDSLERIGKKESLDSLLDNKDSERIITNYYKASILMDNPTKLNYSEGLAPIQIGKRLFAYIDKDGVDRFTITCHNAFPFKEGLARVSYGRYGFINKDGKDGFSNEKDIRFEYRLASDFSNGKARVIKKLRIGSINKDGSFSGRFSFLRLLPLRWRVEENEELKYAINDDVVSIIIAVAVSILITSIVPLEYLRK